MKNKVDMYLVCELIVFFFALSVVFHTITVAQLGGSLLVSSDAVVVTEELIVYRAALTGFLLFVYVSFRVF